LKKILKSSLAILTIAIMVINQTVSAITLGDTVYINDYLHNGKEIATFDGGSGNRLGLLKYNRPSGAVSGWQISYPYYYVENGRKVPVYCLNVYKDRTRNFRYSRI
jgi:hypothetical protein